MNRNVIVHLVLDSGGTLAREMRRAYEWAQAYKPTPEADA